MKLSVKNLSLCTSEKILVDDISFDLSASSSMAIIGPSGSGKTSLLRGILNIADDLVRSGCVNFFGDEKTIRFGYVPQDLALWPHQNVAETLQLAHRFAKNIYASIDDNLVEKIINSCGLDHLRNKKPSQLSGGEKQRLALARALINQPHFLVLDEPFAHLDIVAKSLLIDLINGLKKQFSLSVIFVSHDLAETLALAEVIMIIDHGRNIFFDHAHKLSHKSFLPHWNPLASPLLKLASTHARENYVQA